MLIAALYFVHITLGLVSLVLGPVAMQAPKAPGRHTRAGEAYHWLVLAVCATAGMVAALDWGPRQWFLYVAIFAYGFALLGYLAVKVRWPGWLHFHLSGMGASYVGVWTGVLIVQWKNLAGSPGAESPVAWLLPTIVGLPFILWTNRKAAMTVRTGEVR